MSRPHKAPALWQTLALALIPALALLLAAGLWFTAQTLRDLADSAYDRSLSGAIRAMDLNISAESGGVGVEQPYPLFEAFEATAEGQVYWRVSTDDGLVQIGDALLPRPPEVEPGEMRFYDAVYLGRDVRVGVYRRELSAPLYGAAKPQSIIIEVAETTRSREAFWRSVIRRAMWRDVLAVLLASALIAVGVHIALRPLSALRDLLDRREADDLRQLDGTGLPREVQPLVGALNRQIQRHRAEAELQRRFIDDASHQMKTPIAVLRSQIEFALRAKDIGARDAALAAMLPVTDRMARMTSQLLALARARNAGWRPGDDEAPFDLVPMLGEVARLHLAAARKRRIALELELPETRLLVACSEALLFEAISNLVDNALRASPVAGRVTIHARSNASMAWIDVVDDGPGMSEDVIRAAGERFRVTTNREGGGSGLGLSIVTAIVRGQGGRFTLSNRNAGGLTARIELPVFVSGRNLPD